MGIFDRFKRQRGPDDLISEIGRHLLERMPADFSVCWAHGFMVNGSLEMSLIIKFSENDSAAKRIVLDSEQARELQNLFLPLWQACKAAWPEPWTVATFIIGGDGSLESEFAYELLSADSLAAFRQKWEQKFLPPNCAPLPPPLVKPPIDDALSGKLEIALRELEAKTSGHDLLWQIQDAEQWSVDQRAGTIQFQFADGRTATAPLQFIGSISTNDGTWLWAWDNPSVPEPLRQHTLVVRAYGEKLGHELLTTRKFPCDEELAWWLTALAAKLNNAQGAYRAPAGTALLFLTFGKVTLEK